MGAFFYNNAKHAALQTVRDEQERLLAEYQDRQRMWTTFEVVYEDPSVATIDVIDFDHVGRVVVVGGDA